MRDGIDRSEHQHQQQQQHRSDHTPGDDGGGVEQRV